MIIFKNNQDDESNKRRIILGFAKYFLGFLLGLLVFVLLQNLVPGLVMFLEKG